MTGTVLVSGCFDMLHSGHVGFLRMAAEHGRLIVSVASDTTIARLKGRPPVVGQDERLAMVREMRCVWEATLAPGSGVLDFEPILCRSRPDLLVVNRDGDHPAKRRLCRQQGVGYRVIDHQGGPHTSQLRATCRIPYRIDLAGGWLDQPSVSTLAAGPVIVASIEAADAMQARSGLATSTRAVARRIWGCRLPLGDPVEHAQVLFAAENPPGKSPVSGSQDALGVVLPGVHRLDYAGRFWPEEITPLDSPATLDWLDSRLWLVATPPRAASYDVVAEAEPTVERVAQLAQQAELAWQAVVQRDARLLGQAVDGTWQAQVAMFPRMASPELLRVMGAYRGSCLGMKACGAGGGGYCLLVADAPPPRALPVRIRREEL